MKIAGFEKYEVTSQGEVINSVTKRVLKSDNNRTGYKRVTLSKDGTTYRFFVHRLVALHYLPNPNGYKEVNHLNGIKSDNRVENLEWASSSLNKLHAVKIGLHKPKRGRTFHSEKTKHKVCFMLQEGIYTYDEIANACGVSYNSVCLAKTKRCWLEVSSNYKI